MLIQHITENFDINEGVDDPNIFKAVFMAGGPGSGKSYIAGRLFNGTGLKTVNSDDVYEFLMSKAGLALDPDTIFSPQGQSIRATAKSLTGTQQNMYLDGRLGLVIDGTGKDVDKIVKAKTKLEEIGYDTMMVFVNTNLQTAQSRNKKRARSLDPAMVKKMWSQVQDNIQRLQSSFGQSNFVVLDNSSNTAEQTDSNVKDAEKMTRRFLAQPVRSPVAIKWIEMAREAKKRQ